MNNGVSFHCPRCTEICEQECLVESPPPFEYVRYECCSCAGKKFWMMCRVCYHRYIRVGAVNDCSSFDEEPGNVGSD